MRPMHDDTRDEILDLLEKLHDEIRLVDTYVESHEGIRESTWKDIDQLLTRVYNTLTDLKNIANFS